MEYTIRGHVEPCSAIILTSHDSVVEIVFSWKGKQWSSDGNTLLWDNFLTYKPIKIIISNCWSGFVSATVYDVTRRETFTNLSEVWAKEVDLYSTNQDCIKMLVGNKVDKVF